MKLSCRIKHSWSKWTVPIFSREDDRTEKRICSKCYEIQSREVE